VRSSRRIPLHIRIYAAGPDRQETIAVRTIDTNPGEYSE
jgi:hypothetical protein